MESWLHLNCWRISQNPQWRLWSWLFRKLRRSNNQTRDLLLRLWWWELWWELHRDWRYLLVSDHLSRSSILRWFKSPWWVAFEHSWHFYDSSISCSIKLGYNVGKSSWSVHIIDSHRIDLRQMASYKSAKWKLWKHSLDCGAIMHWQGQQCLEDLRCDVGNVPKPNWSIRCLVYEHVLHVKTILIQDYFQTKRRTKSI